MFESCCSVFIDDACDLTSTTERKARKVHECCECGDVIVPGEAYEHVSTLFDGCWETYKTCIPCRDVRRSLCPTGWYWGQLRDTISDCLGFDYTEDPASWANE